MKRVMLMKKTYTKPIIQAVVSISTGMLMNSDDHRGWTVDGSFYEDDGTYEKNMGSSDHDVTFNTWEQTDGYWVDID